MPKEGLFNMSISYHLYSMRWILLIILIYIIILAAFLVRRAQKKAKIREKIYTNDFISYNEFEKNWIINKRRGNISGSGYKYEDGPGCYIILIFDHAVDNNDWSNYEEIYIGQSIHVYQRVHNHFSGKGNGDVYTDIRNGKHVYVQFVRCEDYELNATEKSLIHAFDAINSYNKTQGGGIHR